MLGASFVARRAGTTAYMQQNGGALFHDSFRPSVSEAHRESVRKYGRPRATSGRCRPSSCRCRRQVQVRLGTCTRSYTCRRKYHPALHPDFLGTWISVKMRRPKKSTLKTYFSGHTLTPGPPFEQIENILSPRGPHGFPGGPHGVLIGHHGSPWAPH